MKKSLIALAAVAGFAVAAVPSVVEAQVSTTASVSALSNYVWRGWNLADAVVVQPSVTFGFGESGFALNIWGSAAITDRDIWEVSDELDFTLSYGTSLGSTALTLSFVEYIFPNAGEDFFDSHSEEVIGVLGFDHSLAPSITAAYDFGLLDAVYISAGIAPSVAVGELTLGLGLSAAVSDYSGEFGFNDVTASANLPFEAGSVTITPSMGYAIVDEAVNADKGDFWAGVTIGF